MAPVPPDDLLTRVGLDPTVYPTREERVEWFESLGRACYEDLRAALPAAWAWEGRSVLDFGCGSGRLLRWFLPHVAEGVRLAGCDPHAQSIEWLRAHSPPEVRLYANRLEPPLPETEASFDLVYAVSVFSHIVDWAPWLLELRRVLKPGGLLVATLHGRGFWSLGVAGSRGEAWDEDGTGLLVEHADASAVDGFGPAVFVSEWWLRAHWGRAFDIVRFEPSGFGMPANRTVGQAWVVGRRPPDHRDLSPGELRAPADDPREALAAARAERLAAQVTA